jgi:hypothetical protein
MKATMRKTMQTRKFELKVILLVLSLALGGCATTSNQEQFSDPNAFLQFVAPPGSRVPINQMDVPTYFVPDQQNQYCYQPTRFQTLSVSIDRSKWPTNGSGGMSYEFVLFGSISDSDLIRIDADLQSSRSGQPLSSRFTVAPCAWNFRKLVFAPPSLNEVHLGDSTCLIQPGKPGLAVQLLVPKAYVCHLDSLLKSDTGISLQGEFAVGTSDSVFTVPINLRVPSRFVNPPRDFGFEGGNATFWAFAGHGEFRFAGGEGTEFGPIASQDWLSVGTEFYLSGNTYDKKIFLLQLGPSIQAAWRFGMLYCLSRIPVTLGFYGDSFKNQAFWSYTPTMELGYNFPSGISLGLNAGCILPIYPSSSLRGLELGIGYRTWFDE